MYRCYPKWYIQQCNATNIVDIRLTMANGHISSDVGSAVHTVVTHM